MGRRRKFTRGRSTPKKGGGSRPKEQKLNMGRLSTFQYRLKMILEGIESNGSIFGNIYSKSTNIGIAEAKEYVESIADEGNLERDKADEILELLKKFSTYR